MVTFIKTCHFVLFLSTFGRHNCQTFWETLLHKVPKQSLENTQTLKAVMNKVDTDESEDKIINHIGYKSPTSNYGLIHQVLQNNHRKSRKYQSGWRSNDVWLDDGDLLVLKGGILNNSNKKHVKRKIFSNQLFEKVNNNVFQPSQRIITHEEVRRNDRVRGVISFNDNDRNILSANDRANSIYPKKQMLDFWGLNIQCFIC